MQLNIIVLLVRFEIIRSWVTNLINHKTTTTTIEQNI